MRVSESILFLAAFVVAHSPNVIDATNIFDDGTVKTEVFDDATDLSNEESAELITIMNEVETDVVETKDSAIGMTSINMLDNKIICGYQGWYSFPGDGSPTNRWRHWFKPTSAYVTAPLAGDLQVDIYPTADEYDVTDLKESGIKMPNGSYAKFFSSVRYNVVLKHFQWMRTYGIAGAFQTRFMAGLNADADREWKTMVLRNSMRAAESTGRIFALSYDISGSTITDAVLDDLKADWIRLVDTENITQSPQYIRQNGLPVLHIFGIGFTHVNVSDTSKMATFIKWMKVDAPVKYRVFLIGGIPSRWRDLTGDSRSDPAWKEIYDSLNGIHPWHVGRWNSISTFDSFHTNTILKDSAYCADKRIWYLPTMWPGFSWYNLKNGTSPINYIPRLGGKFMWRQAYKYAAASNINTVWLAQFDECDEATAIFKLTAKTNDLPVDGDWMALDADAGYSVPSDHYLRLAGDAQKMFEGTIPLRDTFPTPSPTRLPTQKPTTKVPTMKPSTKTPSFKPTPTYSPTLKPTSAKPTNTSTSNSSTKSPTSQPTVTKSPSLKPTTAKPSTPATLKPTTHSPTLKPTTKLPTSKPTTKTPTSKPTKPTTKRTSLTTGARPTSSG